MALRTLRRKIIIREYDFNKVRAQAFAPLACMGIMDTLYDRAEFIPLSQDSVEKLIILDALKGKNTIWNNSAWKQLNDKNNLHNFKDYLYDTRYINWKVTVDTEGYVCVQARKNTPVSRIGWAVFEKDVESRL